MRGLIFPASLPSLLTTETDFPDPNEYRLYAWPHLALMPQRPFVPIGILMTRAEELAEQRRETELFAKTVAEFDNAVQALLAMWQRHAQDAKFAEADIKALGTVEK